HDRPQTSDRSGKLCGAGAARLRELLRLVLPPPHRRARERAEPLVGAHEHEAHVRAAPPAPPLLGWTVTVLAVSLPESLGLIGPRLPTLAGRDLAAHLGRSVAGVRARVELERLQIRADRLARDTALAA